MPEPAGYDPAVLGAILLLQSAVTAQPDDCRMAELLTKGLTRVPGIGGVGLCKDGSVIGAVNLTIETAPQGAQPGETGAGRPCSDGCSCEGTDRIRLKVASSRRSFGYLIIAASDRAAFDLYRPLIENTANMAALTMDNREQEAALLEANRNLEALVASRTAELQQQLAEREKAEDELRESEKRLSDIALSIADWIWEVDQDGVYTFSSPHGSEILRRTREEIIGKTPFDFMPPDEAVRVAGLFAEIAANREPIRDLENWRVGPGGERICLLTNGVPIIDEDGDLKGYRGVDKDITQRKKQEEALSALTARQEAILAAVPDIIAEVDANKVYTWLNQAGLDFFGDDALGKEAASYFEGEQATYRTVQPLFNGHAEVIEVESWQRRRDGAKRLLAWRCRALTSPDGKPLGALSSAHDITADRLAEEALRESEARFRDLAEMLPEAIFEASVDGTLTFANRRAFEAFGYSQEEFARGLSMLDMLAPEERERALSNTWAVLRGERIGPSEYTARRRDGSTFPAWVSSTAVVRRGRAVGVRGLMVDISERKRADDLIRGQLDELQRWYDVTLGREDRVQELKREVNELCRRLGEEVRYTSQQADSAASDAT